jgi:signal transduction histidine kinase
MLRPTPSLALRAVLTFTGVYLVTIAVYLTVAVMIDDAHRNRYTGAKIAISRAAEDLVRTEDGFRMPRDGEFAAMAARNRTMWLIARSGDRSFSFGRVPESVARGLEPRGLLIETGRFYVSGVKPPLANAVLERRQVGSASVLLAAGGVDPETIGFGESLGASWRSGEGLLVWLARTAVMGFVAMLIALPILSRALRPLAAEAASILPQEPARRLDENKAPREVLPLVRGFNAALDRLASELGRRKRFIADAAHELRTPLAVVALRVEALQDETDKQELRRGLGRLVHLVSQMLDIERLSLSGRERLPVDLAGVARDVVAELAPTAIKSGYDLSLEAPDAPVIVTGDAHAISRAITNLIGNSIAHAGGAGQIRVVVGADRTIDVIDEGPGVPAALQPRLFEPFSRGSSDADGCGLGLHLTREIMRAHGGEVWLLPGLPGSAFRLRFAPEAG